MIKKLAICLIGGFFLFPWTMNNWSYVKCLWRYERESNQEYPGRHSGPYSVLACNGQNKDFEVSGPPE